GTSADVAIASSITSTTGHSVQVTNSGSTAVGGNQIAFSGLVTDPGLGINLDNNDLNTNGATVTFSGGLNIDSTTHTGLNATTGTSGHLTVTGDGGGSNNGSGGTIQHNTGNAVSLTSTQDVQLGYMNITNNTGGNGIFGSSLNGIVLTRDTISGNGKLNDNSK